MGVSVRKLAGEVLEIIPLVTRRVAADLRKSKRSMKLAHIHVLGIVAQSPRSLSELSDFHAVSMPTMSRKICMPPSMASWINLIARVKNIKKN